jgi:hypothetical protein
VIDYQQFTVDLIIATKLALAEVASQRPGETLSVFGYETEDVVVLTPVANTVEEHQRMVERGI